METATKVEAPAKSESVAPSTSSSSGKRKFVQDLLECPICFETPRLGPLHNCCNGHFVCESCWEKITECPVCRSKKEKFRNLFAEKILEDEIRGKVLPCAYSRNGCKAEFELERVLDHESVCIYRKVICPAKLRGACNWTGNIQEILRHVNQEKCVQVLESYLCVHVETPTEWPFPLQILKMDETSQTFISVMGDYNDRNSSVFETVRTQTHWKPVFLLNQIFHKHYAYLVTYRTTSGEWIAYVRTFLGARLIPLWTYKLTLRRARAKLLIGAKKAEETKDADVDADPHRLGGIYYGPEYSFQGEMVGSEVTEERVLESGAHLRLKDAQVRQLAIGATLFEFEVELKLRRQTKVEVKSAASNDVNGPQCALKIQKIE
jgi:hypothetical protein